MAKKELPLVVVDSCCFVEFLTAEDPDKADRVGDILEEHGKTFNVVMPSVVYLETLGKSQMGAKGATGSNHQLRQKEFERAREWVDSQDYMMAELDPLVSSYALDLMYQHGVHGIDASILAIAEIYDAEVLYTFDQKMLKAGIPVSNVNVQEPPQPTKLFNSLGT